MNRRRIAEYDVLFLAALIWFLGKFLRYVFPPLFETLQTSYEVSNAAVGTAFTGFMLIYALMQFPSGALADRIGAVTVITAGIAVAGIGSLAIVFDAPFLVLAATMLIVGAGTGAHKTVAARLLARVYPTRPGRALGVHDTFGAFGGVVAPVAVVLFVATPAMLSVVIGAIPTDGWRGIFLVSGIVALALAAVFFVRVPKRLPSDADRGTIDDDRTPRMRDYLALFGDRRFTAFALVTIGFSFAYNGTVAFLPLYLVREAGLATATASVLYSALFAVTFVQLVSGDLSDRVGHLTMIAVTIGLATAGLIGLVVLAGTGPIVLGVAVILFGLGSHGYRPVRSVYLMQVLPDWLAGGGLGVVRTLLMTAGALSPAVVGTTADVAGFGVAFALLAAAVALAAVGAAGLWVTQPDPK